MCQNFPLNTVTIMDVPMKVAVQTSHRLSTILPGNKARAKDFAGFIDAPEINAKKNMSKSIIVPITNRQNLSGPLCAQPPKSHPSGGR
jgi:hypothetical protein